MAAAIEQAAPGFDAGAAALVEAVTKTRRRFRKRPAFRLASMRCAARFSRLRT